jgi:amino acid transporter
VATASINLPVSAPAAPDLVRRLSRFDIVALTLNNMIGAGIFSLPAALAAGAGRWSLAVLFLGIAFASLIALCMVEVASRFDVTGGPMHYAHVAFGPAAGFLVGWLMYLSRLSAFGAISAIMLDYASGVWPLLQLAAIRVSVVTMVVGLLVAINVRGVGRAAFAATILMTLKGTALVVLTLTGLWSGGAALAPAGTASDVANIGGAVALTIFACMGFEHATIVAGEARNPRRDLPVSILAGVWGSGVLYALLLIVCFRVVPDLAHAQRPLADAAGAIGGTAGAAAMSLTAAFSCAANLAGWMLVVPRLLFVLGGRGGLPGFFGTVNAVGRTPAAAIVGTAILVWVFTITGTFIYLATFAAIARILMYGFTCAALITLRRRDGSAPIAIPFGPLLSVASLLLIAFVLGTTNGTAVRDVLIASVVGVVLRAGTQWWVRLPVKPA